MAMARPIPFRRTASQVRSAPHAPSMAAAPSRAGRNDVLRHIQLRRRSETDMQYDLYRTCRIRSMRVPDCSVRPHTTPGESSGVNIKPPLATLILINRNYAAYVGAAIDSILGQDYPHLDVIIVDNCSTDQSRDVIKRHAGQDPRVRFIALDRNLGQLGAYFHIFDEIRGDFVTIVDADDFLVRDFVSSHLQVHIALPQSVAFTSSNVLEINAEGRVITGGYGVFGEGQQGRRRGLPCANSVPRLETVSDRDYRRLAEATALLPFIELGWFWGPGTSNMYRRSILDSTRQRNVRKPYLRAVDAYLNPLCHALSGSALIHQQLSFYRIHDRNYFARRESLHGVRLGNPDTEAVNELLRCETVEFLLQEVEHFVGIVGRLRYWRVIDHVSAEPRGRRVFSLPHTQQALAKNFPALLRTFGDKTLFDALLLRMRPNKLRAVLRKAYGGHIPTRLRRMLLARAAKRRIARWRGKTGWEPYATPPGLFHSNHPDAPINFGPVAILSLDPPIFKTGIAYDEYVGIASAFGKRYGDIPAGFIVYPTWSIEVPGRAAMIAAAAEAHRQRFPNHRFLYLGNTQREADQLCLAGQPAIFLNKNIAVSETIFRPLPGSVIEFDAVYNARFVPEKRHELAGMIGRIAYVGYSEGTARSRQQQRELLAQMLARNSPPTLLNPLVDGLPVRLSQHDTNAAINRAAVGLILSEVEGSNYASMEYMLAGLPVVSTPSKGGRDVFFDPEFCIVCDPNPAAVRDAVEALKRRNIPRHYIRDRTLARIEPERRRLLAIINDLVESLGGERRFDEHWPFGAVSGMVAWNSFHNHLLEFERGAGIATIAEESRIGVEIVAADLQNFQLQPAELRPIVKAIMSRSGCSLLVFGCGNDSTFWEKINREGTTAFLEDDPQWLALAHAKLKAAQAYPVHYDTKLSDWLLLIDTPEKLMLELPPKIMSRRWDVILVDGPAGFKDDQPGRMKSIYAASTLVAPGGCVFVHDCDRPAERQYAARYLGSHRLFVEARGRSILHGYAF
jgi:uncharacterized protein (TIGR01627 family)